MEELRKTLRQFLDERDMRLVKASGYFGCCPATLVNFLNGKHIPNARTIYKIKKGLGLIKYEKNT